jgi:hypothetical protein
VNSGDQFNTPVHWREFDWEYLREAVREEIGIQRLLEACGLLKFFDCPLIQSWEFLCQYMISMWITNMKCFIVRGKQLTILAMEDVYFLMGLPFLGMSLPIDPQFPEDVHLVELALNFCLGLNIMPGSVIHIKKMDDLLHHFIAAMIVRIYGSLVT